MALNSRYMIAPSLEEYFVDKTTGLPLDGGKIFFFSDIDRATLKPIFKLSGSPPNYSYTQLPNPSILSGVGTFQDELNNNILPYYYPYDPDGNVELYYVEVYDKNDVLQFTREAWPNIGGAGGSGGQSGNLSYIPNGQLLLHNNIVAQPINNILEGQITTPLTELAPGGFYFVRPDVTTAVDIVTFPRYDQFVESPTASPRYSLQVQCTTPNASDTVKDLRIRFTDVNKFASQFTIQDQYTFGFSGITIASGSFFVDMKIVKFYGTGGSPSPTETINITSFEITSQEQFFQTSFVFGSNDGKNIGTNNDSYVDIAISFPTNITLGCRLNNFCMYLGNDTILEFSQTTDKDFSARSMVLNTPNYDGYDIGLPVVATRYGLGFDSGSVGEIVASVSTNPPSYAHFCDGSQFLTSGYQDNGVPNKRLFDALYNNNGTEITTYGTGKFFATLAVSASAIASPSGNSIISNNSIGAVSAVADGLTPTGIVFTRTATGQAASYGVKSFCLYSGPLGATNNFIIWNNSVGVVTGANPGTSGFTISTLRTGSTVLKQITEVTVNTAVGTLAGKYFQFSSPTLYYVWFTVDGVGVDPAPGGTAIKINLLSTDVTFAGIAEKIGIALNGVELTSFIFPAGSAIPSGSYFTFETSGGTQTLYYVWFKVNGIGTDPALAGRIGIKVDVLSTDNPFIVRQKAIYFVNSTYFGIPDFRGLFLRGLDIPNNYDTGTRFNLNNTQTGGLNLGTIELDEILSHSHNYIRLLSTIAANGAAPTITLFNNQGGAITSVSGGGESRPINSVVNYYIKY